MCYNYKSLIILLIEVVKWNKAPPPLSEGFYFMQETNEPRELPSYYSIIPARIRYDKDLTPFEKLIYGEITALTNREGYCWASNRYIAEIYNVSQTHISLTIKKLSEKGYIKIVLFKRYERKIYITDISGGDLTTVKGGINQSYKGVLTRVKENNLVNNLNNIPVSLETGNTLKKERRGKCPNPKGHLDCMRVLKEVQSGWHKKFLTIPKQINALHRIWRAGISEDRLGELMDVIDDDKFYRDKGWDLMDVINLISKGGKYAP